MERKVHQPDGVGQRLALHVTHTQKRIIIIIINMSDV